MRGTLPSAYRSVRAISEPPKSSSALDLDSLHSKFKGLTHGLFHRSSKGNALLKLVGDVFALLRVRFHLLFALRGLGLLLLMQPLATSSA